MNEPEVNMNAAVVEPELTAEQIDRIKLIASPQYRRKVKLAAKTRNSRFLNRVRGRYQSAASGHWLGVVPKSVALHNMCGDNAYERTS